MKAGDTHKGLEDNMALKRVYNVHREASLAFAVPVVALAVPAVAHVEPVVDSQVYRLWKLLEKPALILAALAQMILIHLFLLV